MSRPELKRSIVVPAPRLDGTSDMDGADPQVHRPSHAQDEPNRHGARALHASLSKALAQSTAPHEQPERPSPEAPAVASASQTSSTSFWSFSTRRSLKVLVAVAILAVFGLRPLQTILQAASVEAVVNARIATIRSPIDGEVSAAPRDFAAWSATKGAPVLRISNPDAERGRLDDLRRAAARLDDERTSLETRLERARVTLVGLERQTEQFTAGRVRQLEARVAALQSERAGARARAEEASAAFERSSTLARSGYAAGADLARTRRDHLMTAEAERAAQRRVDEATVELTSARTGSFLGDSYNDRPSSAQRADEMRTRIDELSADLTSKQSQRARYAADLVEEEARYGRQAAVEILLPASGRVWEIMVAPGERVRRDQDLMRIVDCSQAVVTANVEETVYNQLRVGGPARFRPSEGGPEVTGTIVNLTGVAGVGGNLAISPNRLQKQSYHATVSVPAIAESAACTVGRTGRVYFDKADPGLAQESAPLPFGLRR